MAAMLENPTHTIGSVKVFGDFKRLDAFIRQTGFTKEDGKAEVLPSLPNKLHQNGTKKTGNELSLEL